MLDCVFVYARPPVPDTGLSHNTRQCAGILRKAGLGAESMALDEIGDWTEFLLNRRPRMVVLGAPLCIPPDRLKELAKAHLETLFVVRVHSNLPFLYQAGREFVAALAVIELSRELPNVHYSVVDPDEAARWRASGLPVIALPNVYCGEIATRPRPFDGPHPYVHLSAMFALRLLKHPGGHVLAAAAVNRNVAVKLYVQTGRADSPNHEQLICRLANTCNLLMPCEPYRHHAKFIEWLGDTIDVGLQLSATESFNYVALEHMALGIPVVASEAVRFCPWRVNYEHTDEAAAMVLRILSDYRACSEQALQAVREIAEAHRAIFLENIDRLLERKEI